MKRRLRSVSRPLCSFIPMIVVLAACGSPPSASPAIGESRIASSGASADAELNRLSLVVDPDLGSGSITAVAADDSRLVAGGVRCDAPPLGSCATALWTSVDGLDWSYVGPLPNGPDVAVDALSAGPRGWVAFAASFAWHSPDGLAWERVDRSSFANGLADGGPGYESEGICCGTQVFDVTPVGRGYVAVGGVTCFKCRGRAAIWRSADGRSWERISYDTDFEGGPMTSVAALPTGRLVAVGAAAWTSDDSGRTWQRHSGAFSGAGLRSWVTAGPDGLTAVGGLMDEIQGVVWHSSDGNEWAREEPQNLRGVTTTAAARYRDGLIVAGQRTSPRDALALFEQAAEDSWRELPSEPDDQGLIAALLEFRGALIAVGSRPAEGAGPASVWIGR